MSINFNGKKQNRIIFNGVEQKRVICNGKSIWAKSYTIENISFDSGISKISISRSDSGEPTASKGKIATINNSGIIPFTTLYYSDLLTITPTMVNGYTLISGPTFVYVSDNLTLKYVTNYTQVLAPDITIEGHSSSFYITIQNNNPYAIRTLLQIEAQNSDGGYLYDDYIDIPARTMLKQRMTYASQVASNIAVMLTTYSSADGKTKSKTQYISVPYSEETTTTTRT